MAEINVQMRWRQDTAANWTSNNPTPLAGEPCFETDTKKIKVGDGSNVYANLAYWGSEPAGNNTQIQYNANGVLGGSAGMTWDNINTRLGIAGQFSAAIKTKANANGAAPTIAVNWDEGNVQKVQLENTGTANITVANGQAGGRYTLFVAQDANGSHAANYVISGVRWGNNTTPTQTTAANKIDVLVFICYAANSYVGAATTNC